MVEGVVLCSLRAGADLFEVVPELVDTPEDQLRGKRISTIDRFVIRVATASGRDEVWLPKAPQVLRTGIVLDD